MKEQLIKKYGKQHRKLIEDALQWLEKKEPTWDTTLDKEKFIRDLIGMIK